MIPFRFRFRFRFRLGVQMFKPYGDRARILRMLAEVFGAEKADLYLGRLQGMCWRQRRLWPWFGTYLAQSPRRMWDLFDLAASEVILLADQHPGVDPLDRPDGDTSLLVRAWAEATRWAWKDGGINRAGQPRQISLDVFDSDGDNLAPVADDYDEGPEVTLDGLTAEQQRLLAGKAAGLPFTRLAEMEGLAHQTLEWRFRRAVASLIRRNPWMVDRWGLRPCAGHRTGRDCPACKGYGFTYTDGGTLGRSRRRR